MTRGEVGTTATIKHKIVVVSGMILEEKKQDSEEILVVGKVVD
jgi:hypothetical protein